VEVRQIEAPPGYATELTVGVRPTGEAELEGFAIAFGAAVGRCLALIYTTRAAGGGAEALVGHRLQMVVDGTIAGLASSTVDDRARRLRIER
jgi:hypothetical protein